MEGRMHSKQEARGCRRTFSLTFVVTVSLLATPHLVSARAPVCLESSAIGAQDAKAIRLVRDTIDAECPCASFDGVTKGRKHADYVKCAHSKIKAGVSSGL